MRLSQLARKLDKSPTELIAFFQKHSVGSYSSHNNKVSEEDMNTAILHFNPDLLTEENEKDTEITQLIKNTESEDQISPDLIHKNTENEILISNAKDAEFIADKKQEKEVEEIQEEEVEVIRAPKIKLEGVKVVGKIELPETKKIIEKKPSDEDKLVSDVIQKVLKGKKPARKKSDGEKIAGSRSKVHHNSRKSTHKELTYEEKLKREEKRRQKNKELSKQKIKNKKKQYYIKNVKPLVTSSTKSSSKKREVEMSETLLHTPRPVHKNPIRKFWGWLNGEYDYK